MSESQEYTSPFYDLAVVIGINGYQDNELVLKTAKLDAKRLADILDAKPHSYDVTLLTEEEATYSNIWDFLKNDLPEKIKLGENRKVRLLFYFAGHGSPAPKGEDYEVGYLLPQDAQPSNLEKYLSMKDLNDALAQLGCHHLLIILDCCHAGAYRFATRGINSPPEEELSKQLYDRYLGPVGQVITSAADDQKALDELKVLTKFYDNRGNIKNTNYSLFAKRLSEAYPDHSPFAALLFNALEVSVPEEDPDHPQNGITADYNRNGITTATGLGFYLNEKLRGLTEEQKPPQISRTTCLPKLDKGEFFFKTGEFDPTKLPDALELNEDNNPYRGLKSFEEANSRLFFGRSKEINDLYKLIDSTDQPLTVVLGGSGSGKSSLVKAGLIQVMRDPKLRTTSVKQVEAQQDKNTNSEISQASSEIQSVWQILEPIRPGASPFMTLAKAALQLKERPLNFVLLQKLDELLRQARRKNREDGELKDLFAKWRRMAPEDKLLLIIQKFDLLKKYCGDQVGETTLSNLRELGLSRSRLMLDHLYMLKQASGMEEQNQLDSLHDNYKKEYQNLSDDWQNDKDGEKFGKFIKDNVPKDEKIKVLLVIDQFEELITLCKREERQKFLNTLQAALKACPQQLRLVLTLRDDFRHDFENTDQLKAYWKKACFSVPPMDYKQLREVIEQPALAQVLSFEEKDNQSLVDQILKDIGDTSGVLPLLSFTLSQLYLKSITRMPPDRKLSWEDYDALGGVTKALTGKANEVYEGLAKKEVDNIVEVAIESPREKEKVTPQTMLRWVMLRMVNLEGGVKTRRAVLENELEYADEKSNKCRKSVIEHFLDARLFVKGTNLERKTYYEPAHDVLIREWKKIDEWQNETHEQANEPQNQPDSRHQNKQWLRQMLHAFGWNNKAEEVQIKFDLNLQRVLTSQANSWDSKRQDAEKAQSKNAVGLLWNADPRLPQLEYIQHTDNWLNKTEAQFVEASIAKKQRGIRNFWILVATAFFGVISYTGYIWYQNQLSQLRVKAAQSENLLSTDPVAGLVGAIDAMGKNQSTFFVNRKILPEVQSALLSAVQTARESYRFKQLAQSTSNQQGQTDNNQQISSVSAVTFSPDGNTIASADKEGHVYLWNLQGKQIGQPVASDGKSYGFNSLEFSQNGKFLIGGGEKKSLPVDPPVPRGEGGSFLSHNFNFNKKSVEIQNGVQAVKVWELQNNKLVQISPFSSYSPNVFAAAFSQDGKLVVSGGSDGTLRLWDVQANPISQNKTDETSPPQGGPKIYAVAFSSKGNFIVSADSDRKVYLWKISKEKKILIPRILVGECKSSNKSIPRSVAMSEENQQIICNLRTDDDLNNEENDGDPETTFVTIWKWKEKEIWEPIVLKSGDNGFFSRILFSSFSPNSQAIVTSDQDGSIRLWGYDPTHTPPILNPIGQPLLGDSSKINSVAFSSNGQKIISGSDDGTIRLRDVEQKLSNEESFTNQVKNEQKLSNEKSFINQAYIEEQYKTDGGGIIKKPGINLILSYDGKKVAIFSKKNTFLSTLTLSNIPGDNKVSNFNISPPKDARTTPDTSEEEAGSDAHTMSETLAVSSNGYVVFLDYTNHFIPTLWHPESKPETQPIVSPRTTNADDTNVGDIVAISPDGKSIAYDVVKIKVGDPGLYIQYWDVSKNKPIGKPEIIEKGHGYSSIAFSSDGKKIFIGKSDLAKSSVCSLPLQGDRSKSCNNIPGNLTGKLQRVAFSPDSEKVAISLDDGRLYLWNLLSKINSVSQHFGKIGQPVTGIAFSTDTIASGTRDGSVRLWNLDGTPIGRAFQTFTNPNKLLSSIAFDDKKVIVAYTDGSVGYWKTTDEDFLKVGCDRLLDHPALKDPQTDEAKGAEETCVEFVWNLGQKGNIKTIQPTQVTPTSIPDHVAKETSWHQLDSISNNNNLGETDSSPDTDQEEAQINDNHNGNGEKGTNQHPIKGSNNSNLGNSKNGRGHHQKSSSSSRKLNLNKSTPSNPWSIETND